MSSLLQRVQAQNETWFRKLPPSKTRFRGILMPTDPNKLPTSVFVLPRLGLRTRLREPVQARDLFRDPFDRVLLVGDHDMTLSGNTRVSVVYSLFQMTQRASWQSRTTTISPTTGLSIAKDGLVEKGPIWISLESYTHGDNDPGLRITIDRLRVVTAARLVLGDLVAGKAVKRINESLGVTIAEIE